jgi:hypothetical protein
VVREGLEYQLNHILKMRRHYSALPAVIAFDGLRNLDTIDVVEFFNNGVSIYGHRQFQRPR